MENQPQQNVAGEQQRLQAAAAAANQNVIRLYGFSETNCGYCKGQRASVVQKTSDSSSRAYTVLIERMTPAVYEAFLLRGWRRSGLVLYKPDNWQSCCPAMTIRLPVERFRMSKSQRKILRRMNSVLSGPTSHRQQQEASTAPSGPKSNGAADKANRKNKDNTWTARLLACLEKAGMLDQLQQITEQALAQALEVHQQQNDKANTISDDALARIKPSYKIQKPPNNNNKAKGEQKPAVSMVSDDNDEKQFTKVTLFSTVCAAISGRSKGRIDRATLSEQLLTRLQPKLVASSFSIQITASTPQGGGTSAAAGTTATVTVTKVDRHEASGQIFVHLTVPNALMQALETPSTPSEQQQQQQPHPGVDRLAKWWHAEQRQQQQSARHGTAGPVEVGIPPLPPPPHELTVTTLPAHDSALDPTVHRLYWKYQHAVHGDPDPFAPPSGTTSVGDDDPATSPLHRNWGAMAPSTWVERAKAMLAAEYHDRDGACQERLLRGFVQFYEFLVENPFVAQDGPNNVPLSQNHQPAGASTGGIPIAPSHAGRLGTYHQHYRLANGGPLIAVGVVDLLPTGLSSVYLYYDPSFATDLVPLGKYAILKEIEWTRQHALPYYYLGYYIESCTKMRYKADYMPSELLCPTTYTWVDAEQAKATIQAKSPFKHCCTLAATTTSSTAANSGGAAAATDGNVNATISQLRMQVGQPTPVTINMLTPAGQGMMLPILKDFAIAAGPSIAPHCTINLT